MGCAEQEQEGSGGEQCCRDERAAAGGGRVDDGLRPPQGVNSWVKRLGLDEAERPGRMGRDGVAASRGADVRGRAERGGVRGRRGW